MNKEEKDKKTVNKLKVTIIVFGVLAILNFIFIFSGKSYALFHKTIETDKVVHIQTADSASAVDIVKATLGQSNGIIGVKSDNSKTIKKADEVREYRYSGLDVNNYVYYNCQDGKEQNADNCEKWRIVGIFKDESGAEHLKIVRNEVLTKEMFPETYTVGETKYKIQFTEGNYAYWNYNETLGQNNSPNDWSTAGLQYWLNAGSEAEAKSPENGYMSYLSESAKGMIEEKTKYYLGAETYDAVGTNGILDTPAKAYENERAVEGCNGLVGPTDNNSQSTVEGNTGCRVWNGNKTFWEGKVALLYPSDYGFSIGSENWNIQLKDFNNVKSSSWLSSANHGSFEWFLSPSSGSKSDAAPWSTYGTVGNSRVYSYSGVRPAITIVSDIRITSGTGEENSPYSLEV